MRKYIQSILGLLICIGCSQEKELSPAAVKVEVTKVTSKDVPNYIEAIGNIYAYSIVEIRPQVQGILLKSYVEQGSYVEKGDPLYEIDPRPYQAALDQAEATLLKDQASLELAKNTLERYSDLVKKEYISQLTYDQYKTNVDTAEAQVALDLASIQLAKINLGYTKISSPIAGKVGVYNIYPGNLVVVNDPTALIEIRQFSPVDVRFSVPQKDFQEIQKYQNMQDLHFEAYLPYENDRTFGGTLYFIDNHIDLQTGTILLKGIVQNEEHTLWPGQYIRVRIFTHIEQNALVIPYAALQMGQKGTFVYVVQPDNTVRTVDVTTGQKINDLIAVESGLKLGDQVVINGQLNLKNGSSIIIANSLENKSP